MKESVIAILLKVSYIESVYSSETASLAASRTVVTGKD